MFTTLINTGLT